DRTARNTHHPARPGSRANRNSALRPQLSHAPPAAPEPVSPQAPADRRPPHASLLTRTTRQAHPRMPTITAPDDQADPIARNDTGTPGASQPVRPAESALNA